MDRERKMIHKQNAQQDNAGTNAYDGNKPVLVSAHRITADRFVNEKFFSIRGCKVCHDLGCVNVRCLLLILAFVFAPMPK